MIKHLFILFLSIGAFAQDVTFVSFSSNTQFTQNLVVLDIPPGTFTCPLSASLVARLNTFLGVGYYIDTNSDWLVQVQDSAPFVTERYFPAPSTTVVGYEPYLLFTCGMLCVSLLFRFWR